jgi:hypothetical protein
MAARGARSRKIIEKEISRERNKRTAGRLDDGGSTPELGRVMSPVSGWGKRGEMASDASIYSRESEASSSRIASKLASFRKRDDKKHPDAEKRTVAPRGRKGGVPSLSDTKLSRSDSKSTVKPGSSWSTAQSIRSTSRLGEPPVTFAKTWDNTKIWFGGETQTKQFLGFDHVGAVNLLYRSNVLG